MSGRLRREQFLAGAAAGAAAVAGLRPGATQAAPEPLRPGAPWPQVREQFDLAPGVTQMTAFLLASHPRPVRLAIERHRHGLDANPHEYLERQPELEERVLAAAARYVGGAATEVALTGNTTTGLALVYRGIRVAPGDELLTSTHDFYSTHEALRLRAQSTGASLRKIQLYRDPVRASVDEILSSLAKAITPATRVVALTWVHSSTGVKLPVRRIAELVRNVNRDRPPDKQALLCIDGVHGFGAEATPAARLGCDFFVSGTHKWLFGPRGTGLAWGRASAWQRVTPLIPSFSREAIGAWLFDRAPTGPPGPLMTPGGYQAFEHRWALAEAFQFRNTIGPVRAERRTHELATRLKQGLRELRRVSLVTPVSEELSAGLVCCSVEGSTPTTPSGGWPSGIASSPASPRMRRPISASGRASSTPRPM